MSYVLLLNEKCFEFTFATCTDMLMRMLLLIDINIYYLITKNIYIYIYIYYTVPRQKQQISRCLVHAFKNWKLLFENMCRNTYE